jgi:hypothetical protein
VLLQLYSPSGGFTYPHRQLLGRLFNETYPKGYWVSRESFESALKRKNLHSAGKLRSNAWTLSALVDPAAFSESEHEAMVDFESKLINALSKAKLHIINGITNEPGTEDTIFHFVKVDLTDKSQPGYANQLAALGFFATNHPTVTKSNIKTSTSTSTLEEDFQDDTVFQSHTIKIPVYSEDV